MVLRTVMGEESPHLDQFKRVRYSPQVWSPGMDTSRYRPAGVRKGVAILEAAKGELELRAELEDVVVQGAETQHQREAAEERGRVFIVHGHDGERKHELARLVQALTGTVPVILHEQPNGGRTLLEKLEGYAASVGFAVALLTADDVGRAKNAKEDLPRARQNVLLEAGYFAGRLGRARVVLLYERGVELPSDLHGLAYLSLDDAWKQKLAHEMASQGMPVDWAELAGL